MPKRKKVPEKAGGDPVQDIYRWCELCGKQFRVLTLEHIHCSRRCSSKAIWLAAQGRYSHHVFTLAHGRERESAVH
jgi:hypothetical protein